MEFSATVQTEAVNTSIQDTEVTDLKNVLVQALSLLCKYDPSIKQEILALCEKDTVDIS